MNKRQRKKNEKKQEMFIASWVSSYRELRELNRRYHEYAVSDRRRPYDYIWGMYFDEFEDVNYD